jgi:hypothetical protein
MKNDTAYAKDEKNDYSAGLAVVEQAWKVAAWPWSCPGTSWYIRYDIPW